MSPDKRERHRVKRAQKRKRKVRHEAYMAETSARQVRAVDAACNADQLLRGGQASDAAGMAARAVTLSPKDRDIAALYVAAAVRSGNLQHQLRAHEHLAGLVAPTAPLFIRLADLRASNGDVDGARQLLPRARAIFPRRMKERRRWLAYLESVERRCAPAPLPGAISFPPTSETLPLFGPVRAERETTETSPRLDSTDPQASRAASQVVAEQADEAGPEPQPAAPAAVAFDIPVGFSASIDGLEELGRKEWRAPEEVHLSLLAARIREAESFDRLLSVERASGLIRLSHQEETTRKVMSVLLGRALLADEVGLGKTVEAGLVLSEYQLRGRVERTLILTPPTLVDQWREELATKFGIETRTTEQTASRSDLDRFWSAPGVVIASLATARSPQHRETVAARPWDLIIVDEAHALKNARTQSYTLVSRLRSRFLLLLTATPIENNVEELFNLVSLIRPGHLGGRADFVRRLGGKKGRVSEAARREVRTLLGEVMIRNTRALSGVRLPPRFARTVLVEPHPAERQLYEHLVAALRAFGLAGRARFRLSLLLQEAGSSPHAVRATLEKMQADSNTTAPVKEALAPAIACTDTLLETGKGRALKRILVEGDGPTIVFTRFRATLGFLSTFLAAHQIRCERVDGSISTTQRHAAIARCREGGGVLLSTDVGSEGLNLQFCRRIVNFDLPWNPMRIEQRIGRVHRIGQEHPVDVVNLCLAGSIEERILSILDERINLFELVVGEVEMILGYLEEERDFSDLVFDAFATPEPEERERSFSRIGEKLALARQRYQNVKVFDEEFFRNELGV